MSVSKSSISLTVDSGPKKGETLDRKSGSVIRIGRVVKGNTLAIKDPFISQKHLTIEFDPLISRWVLKCLATANGTFINGVLLSSSDSLVLISDGDTVKIGESTSISVRVSPIEENGRRTRNHARVSRKDEILRNSLDVKEGEDEAVEEGMKVQENLGRERRGKCATALKKDEILDPDLKDERIELLENSGINSYDFKENIDETVVDRGMNVLENLGRGRRRKSAMVSKADGAAQDDAIIVTKNLRKGRRADSIQILEKDPNVDLIAKEKIPMENEDLEPLVEAPKNLGRGRRGKSARVSKTDDVVEGSTINVKKNLRSGKRTDSIQILEKDPSTNLIAKDSGGNSSSVFMENVNLEPLVEGCMELKNLGRGRRNSKKDVVLPEDKNRVQNMVRRGRGTRSTKVFEDDDILNSEDKISLPKTMGKGRRTRSTKVLEEDDISNSEDKISMPKNAGRGRRTRSTRVSKLDETLDTIVDEGRTESKKNLGKGTQMADSSKVSKADGNSNVVAEEAVEAAKNIGKEKPRRPAVRRTRASCKVSKDESEHPLNLKDPVLIAAESSYQSNEIREGFHQLSQQDKREEMSLVSPSTADSKDKRSADREGKENCVSVKCQKKENETLGTQTHKPSRVAPKVWNGNGIPNTTTKYKEDQKVSWHGTPFEERVEKALSDEKLFSQRNLTN